MTFLLKSSCGCRAAYRRLTRLPRRTLSSAAAVASREPCYQILPPDVAQVVDEYTQKEHTLVSLQRLLKTGRGEYLKSYKSEAFLGRMGQRLATQRILIQDAGFLRQEIPIRLAHRIRDLDQVPLLRDMPSVQAVKSIYVNSFLEMKDFPTIQTPEEEQQFARMLQRLYLAHQNVLVQMARGAYELRAAIRSGKIEGMSNNSSTSNSQRQQQEEESKPCSSRLEFELMDQCHSFLDRFYMSRIGIRVLAGQYLALRGRPNDNYIGMICLETSPSAVVRQAAHDATQMCRKFYGRAPHIQLTGCLNRTFPYIPTYLHYVVLELLKNALRATTELHYNDKDKRAPLPPVEVVIADGQVNEDVVIKIADQGGGIPRSHMRKIWSYLFTTADPKIQESIVGEYEEDHSKLCPIAGLGYGLPISRSYCRYFGGELDIISMEGYGTDAYLHLKRLGDTKEPVPL